MLRKCHLMIDVFTYTIANCRIIKRECTTNQKVKKKRIDHTLEFDCYQQKIISFKKLRPYKQNKFGK